MQLGIRNFQDMTNIHLKTAWDHIRRSPFQALAAVIVLSVTFFVVTVISVLVYSSSSILKYFETRPQVIAFLIDDAQIEDISNLQNKLTGDARVKDVLYVSKKDALEIYKSATSDNPLLSELVSPSIFPASLEFSLVDLNFADEVIKEVKSEDVVEQIGFTATVGFGEESIQNVVDRLRTVTLYLRIGGGGLAFLLVGTSFLVLLIIISMRMTTRREEVEILDLIGATVGFIRSPIIFEALLYAFFGVLIGWVVALLLVLYTTPSAIAYFGDIPVLPKNTSGLLTLFGIILISELLLGFILAFIGSMFAVSRARRRK